MPAEAPSPAPVHQLTFRHDGPMDMARCSCGRLVLVEDLPHAAVGLLESMKAYLEEKGL
jgi:hypothetical protein